MSNPDSTDRVYMQLPGGEVIYRAANAGHLLDGLRRRVAKAQEDLAVQLADIQQLAGLLSALADENRTVGSLPGPGVW